MMKHIAIPQSLINEKSRLDFADTSGMDENAFEQHKADRAANDAAFALVGDIPMTEQEIADRQAEEAAYLAAQPRLDLLARITALENTITPRRRDEAILGLDGGWLLKKRGEISALRAELGT